MPESNLITHANRELDIMGFPQLSREQIRSNSYLDENNEYNSRKAIMEIVTTFSKQGHSGGSAYQVLTAITQLLQYKPLSPLTNNPDEWMLIDPTMTGGKNLWQNKRKAAAFSEDGGKTFYFVDKYTRMGRLMKKLPKNRLTRWVWNHKNWIHKMNTAKEASK